MQVQIPTLLLDENKCRKNIKNMAGKANNSQVRFRPHFKTHQSAEIGRWFAGSGVTSITVSSVQMAEYFANAGWKDILIAFPVNIREIEKINKLAQEINLHLLVESTEIITFLNGHLKFRCGIYLKIDTGYHRTGLSPDDDLLINKLSMLIKKSDKLSFTGILTHAGHAYNAKNIEEILEIHKQSIQQLIQVREIVLSHFSNCIVSIGDTPTCSLAKDFAGVDEIRPGNFVFYDVMQYYLGTCNFDQIAVALACPVVAKHQSRNEIVIYGGGIHCSKEAIYDTKHMKIYGLVVELKENGWGQPLADTYLSAISQEHGIITTTSDDFGFFKIGETIGIMPVHACLTANLMSHLTTIENKKIEKFRFIS